MNVLTELRKAYGLTVTPAIAASVLHCSPDHVRKMCQRGVIKAARFENRWVIPVSELAAVIEIGTVA